MVSPLIRRKTISLPLPVFYTWGLLLTLLKAASFYPWIAKIRSLVTKIQRDRKASPLLLSKPLGKMVLAISIVPWARLHLRDLQYFLLPFQNAGRGTSSSRIPVPREVLSSLRWWRSPAISRDCLFLKPPWLVVSTNASMFV